MLEFWILGVKDLVQLVGANYLFVLNRVIIDLLGSIGVTLWAQISLLEFIVFYVKKESEDASEIVGFPN